VKSEAAAPFSVQLGTDVPRGAPSTWGPICGVTDCDAFVTIVTPLFSLAAGAPQAAARFEALADLLARIGLSDAPLANVGQPSHGGLSFATDAVAPATARAAVVVRGISVGELEGPPDLAKCAAADLAAGAAASAWLLVDSERATVPLLGTVLVSDGTVVRAPVEVVADAAFARLRVEVVDDRRVFRAEFAMPWIATSTLATLGAAAGIGVEVGSTVTGLLPWPARWAVFFGTRPG
jgi:hypothetical protein